MALVARVARVADADPRQVPPEQSVKKEIMINSRRTIPRRMINRQHNGAPRPSPYVIFSLSVFRHKLTHFSTLIVNDRFRASNDIS